MKGKESIVLAKAIVALLEDENVDTQFAALRIAGTLITESRATSVAPQ